MTAPDAGLAALKPCPFSGDEPQTWCAPDSGGRAWWVGSPVCQIGSFRTQAAARLAWNHRPSPTTGDAGLADEIEVAIEAFHDALPRGQGETGDGGVAGKAMCQMFYDNADAILSALRQPAPRADDALRAKYEELLYAVSRKYEGEDRHETALRYIREREADINEPARAALAASEEPKRAVGEG